MFTNASPTCTMLLLHQHQHAATPVSAYSPANRVSHTTAMNACRIIAPARSLAGLQAEKSPASFESCGIAGACLQMITCTRSIQEADAPVVLLLASILVYLSHNFRPPAVFRRHPHHLISAYSQWLHYAPVSLVLFPSSAVLQLSHSASRWLPRNLISSTQHKMHLPRCSPCRAECSLAKS